MTAVAEWETIAYRKGLAEGLRSALNSRVPPGFAVVPTDMAGSCRIIPHSVAAEEGVALVMNNGHAEADPDLPGRLVGVRLGVLRNVLDEAIGHLSARISDGEPLLRRQLVTGAVADIVAEAEMARRLIATPDIAHSAITDARWEVTKLFGAAGYITDQPARALYVSALIANMWGLDR
jgi:hypothetical protein